LTIILNPVKTQMVKDASDWPWSGYRAMIGQAARLIYRLQVDGLLSQFGSDREQAIARYRDFVRVGIGLPPVWEELDEVNPSIKLTAGNFDIEMRPT
jgi:putative transposase